LEKPFPAHDVVARALLTGADLASSAAVATLCRRAAKQKTLFIQRTLFIIKKSRQSASADPLPRRSGTMSIMAVASAW
jgi:hypothetical protein